jgi:hypothetical protein
MRQTVAYGWAEETPHKHQVKYVTIGGIAAILYGVPRATFDLDTLDEHPALQ